MLITDGGMLLRPFPLKNNVITIISNNLIIWDMKGQNTSTFSDGSISRAHNTKQKCKNKWQRSTLKNCNCFKLMNVFVLTPLLKTNEKKMLLRKIDTIFYLLSIWYFLNAESLRNARQLKILGGNWPIFRFHFKIFPFQFNICLECTQSCAT